MTLNALCVAASLMAIHEYEGKSDVMVSWAYHGRDDIIYNSSLLQIVEITSLQDFCAMYALLFLTVYTVRNNGLGTQEFSKKYRYVNDVPNSCKETITKVTTQDRGHYLGTRVVTRQH